MRKNILHPVKKMTVFLLILLTGLPVWADYETLPPLPPGPLLLTSVTPEQLNPDYWINRLPEPDKILKSPAELAELNSQIHAMIKDCVDVFKLDNSRRGSDIRDHIEMEYKAVSNRLLFDVDDQKIPASVFSNQIKPVMDWDSIPDRIQVRWGAAIRAASVRSLPSDIKMLEEEGDIEFDQLQYTQIKLWTPVAIYHTSSDGQWFYVQAPYSRGWVKARDLAVFSGKADLQKYTGKKNAFLVVTGESVPVYQAPSLQTPILRASMGTFLPIARGEIVADGGAGVQNVYEVWMPNRTASGSIVLGKGYVDVKSDVTEGFMPFTQRNIIRQAFKLLGARYGWGGTYNGRDCSGFLHDVFLSLGVDMPRTSKQQGFVGTQFSQFDPYNHADAKVKFLREARPGITLLRMPSHQMIYLGEINGNFYVIHSTWAERYSMTSDDKNRINQVVVSDLNLNGKSYLGSLFDRIISINEVD